MRRFLFGPQWWVLRFHRTDGSTRTLVVVSVDGKPLSEEWLARTFGPVLLLEDGRPAGRDEPYGPPGWDHDFALSGVSRRGRRGWFWQLARVRGRWTVTRIRGWRPWASDR